MANGTSGLLVPAQRPDQLAAALVHVADDPELHARLAAGATEAAPRFSAARSAREIEAAYDRALTTGALRSAGRSRPWF